MTKPTAVKRKQAHRKKPVDRAARSHKTAPKTASTSMAKEASTTRKTYDGLSPNLHEFKIGSQGKQHTPMTKHPKHNRRGWIFVAVAILLIIGAIVLYNMQQQTGNTSNTSSQTVTTSKQTGSMTNAQQSTQSSSDAEQRLSMTKYTIENSSFSTDTVFKLNVPVYRQVYTQSCEAASLRMALAYRGVETTDMKLLNQLGYDGKVAETVNNQMVWTDPHKQFVGDKDGDQADFTGYGVFAEPIAAAAKKDGRDSEIKNEVTTEWIVQQLYAGNPVILWGVSIKIADATWQTADGKTITVPMRTHTRLVIGFKGDPKNPDGFYINDPAVGAEKYWATGKLQTNISQGIKQAVVVK